MRTEKALKKMLTWKNPNSVIEQLLVGLDEAKDKIYRRNKQIKNLKEKIVDLEEQLDRLAYLETDPNAIK